MPNISLKPGAANEASNAKKAGIIQSLIVNKLDAAVAPTASNDITQGYVDGSKWVDTVAGITYWCVDHTATAARWVAEAPGLWSGYKATKEIWLRRRNRQDSRYVPPSAEAFKLASPAFMSRARVIAGDVRVISIGNSYRVWPEEQMVAAFVNRPDSFGNYSAVAFPINTGTASVTGSAATAGAGSTLVPQQDGHWNIPNGSSVRGPTQVGSGCVVGYVVEAGAGTLTIERSNDGGSTWTTLATVNCNGATAYQTYTATGWSLSGYMLRLSATVGTVKVGMFCVTGSLSHLAVTTGSSAPGGYAQWSEANLIREATEAWWAAYDPDFVFVRYSDEQALDPEWSRFVSILTTACPNAQIVMIGEHSNSTSDGRDADYDNYHLRGNDSLRVACSALRNFCFVDVWHWLPNFADAYSVGTMTSPDGIHLSAVGNAIVRSCVWEALRPWIFPTGSSRQAASNYRARTIFETSGWQQTGVLESDVSVANDADASDGPYLFSFTGLDPQGWYLLEYYLRVTSNSTVGARIGLSTPQGQYFETREGGGWNSAGTYAKFDPPVNANPGINLIAAFSAGGSTFIWRASQTFQLNATGNLVANKPGYVLVTGAQWASNATPVVFGRGSVVRLTKMNMLGRGGNYHRDLLPV